jgi:uncharacterized protein DUF3159
MAVSDIQPRSVEPELGRPDSLTAVLGGRRGALDAAMPPAVFVAGWLLTNRSVGWASAFALVAALIVAGLRWRRGARPYAVLVGLLGVAVAAYVAVRTGRAADFFLVQLASNAASALTWLVSMAVRWPLLGVVVGTVLGQRTRWRRDPDLLRGYTVASWAWVGQYLVRVAAFGALYWAVIALGVARVALSWPLVAASLAVSWGLLRRSLPDDHPGIRHPRTRT